MALLTGLLVVTGLADSEGHAAEGAANLVPAMVHLPVTLGAGAAGTDWRAVTCCRHGTASCLPTYKSLLPSTTDWHSKHVPLLCACAMGWLHPSFR